jgi:hypothetical protein
MDSDFEEQERSDRSLFRTIEGSLVRAIEIIDRYWESGTDPGSGIQAILEGNLYRAFERCDRLTLANLQAIVGHIVHNLPIQAYGSVEAVITHKRRKAFDRQVAENGPMVCKFCNYPWSSYSPCDSDDCSHQQCPMCATCQNNPPTEAMKRGAQEHRAIREARVSKP